jgi:hypothetical protein
MRSPLGRYGNRLKAFTCLGRTTGKWRDPKLATSVSFSRSATAMTDASMAPSGRSASGTNELGGARRAATAATFSLVVRSAGAAKITDTAYRYRDSSQGQERAAWAAPSANDSCMPRSTIASRSAFSAW